MSDQSAWAMEYIHPEFHPMFKELAPFKEWKSIMNKRYFEMLYKGRYAYDMNRLRMYIQDIVEILYRPIMTTVAHCNHHDLLEDIQLPKEFDDPWYPHMDLWEAPLQQYLREFVDRIIHDAYKKEEVLNAQISESIAQ